MTIGGEQYIGGHKLNGNPQRSDSRSKWPNRLMSQGPEGVVALIKPRVLFAETNESHETSNRVGSHTDVNPVE
jgi:hypothetical protein